MNKTERIGKAQTVLGLIEGSELGITLTHEHLFIEGKGIFTEPSCASEVGLAYEKVGLSNLSWFRYHPYENLDNMRLLDEREAIDEAMLYQQAGGKTIVDVTNIGIGRDAKALARISRATGLNIIMGSGYYTAPIYAMGLSVRSAVPGRYRIASGESYALPPMLSKLPGR